MFIDNRSRKLPAFLLLLGLTSCGDLRLDPSRTTTADAGASPDVAEAGDGGQEPSVATLSDGGSSDASSAPLPDGGSVDTNQAPAGDGGSADMDPAPVADGSLPEGDASPALACSPPAVACRDVAGKAAGCHPAAWGFEPGGTEGWLSTGFPDSAVVAAYMVSEDRAHSGRRSLTAALRAGPGKDTFEFDKTLCPAATSMDRRGRTLAAWLYVDGPPAGAQMRCRLYGWSAPLPVIGSKHLGPALGQGYPTGSWVRLVVPLTEAEAGSLVRILLHCFLPGGDWIGAAYLDDVTID